MKKEVLEKKEEEITEDVKKEKKSKKEKNSAIVHKDNEKKENKDNSEITGKFNIKKISIISGIAVIILLFISTIFSVLNLNNEKIISGVSISGMDVSGLSKNEATEKIKNIYNEKIEKEIGIKYQDYEATLSPKLMEVNYEIDNALEEAWLTGRNSNIIVNNYKILSTLLAKKNINVNMGINEEVTKKSIEDIEINLPGVMIESNYSIEEDELIILKGKAGIGIDKDNLLEKIKEKLNDINAADDDIELQVIDKTPQEIDIQKIHDEIYTEAKDAYYTKDPFTVYPEVEGIDFDVEAAKKILEEEKEEYVIPLTITKPKITLDDIGSEAFPDKLATFTTRYDASDSARTTNLIIACRKINGKVVAAGETFSYNSALGARTASAGYKNAKVYENGEVVDGIGGGICQISSTLYNAILMANLETVERRNHQFVTSYLPAGRDATVVYGLTDFKFKNTRQYPIRIVASAQNGIATVSIYGIKEENEYTFSISTRTVETIPSTVKYVDDPTLSVGTEKVKQKGANGLKTETYITKMLDGKVISTKLLSKDTYDAMARIILRGTSGEATTTTTEQSTMTQPTSTVEEPTTTQPTTPTSQETQTNTTATNTTGE